MKVFLIVATRNATAMADEATQKGFAMRNIREGAWLLAANLTTQEVSEQIGMRDGRIGSGVVCEMRSYNGRLPKDIWEWVTLQEAKSA